MPVGYDFVIILSMCYIWFQWCIIIYLNDSDQRPIWIFNLQIIEQITLELHSSYIEFKIKQIQELIVSHNILVYCLFEC